MKKLWHKFVSWWKYKFSKPQSPTLDTPVVMGVDVSSRSDTAFISTRPKDSGSRFF